MDLSAVIFVVLAVAWAVYLIPKALKHHDEMASDRLVEGHSDRVRILSRRGRAGTSAAVELADVAEEQVAPAAEVTAEAPVEQVAEMPARTARPLPTRAAAKRAARNRRRVLGVLVLALAVLATLAFLAYVPWWSTAVPGGLVVLFLVVARLTVRRSAAARRPQSARAQVDPAPVAQEPAETLTARLAEEDTSGGLVREEIEAALADDGSLWDPLPMTLPTYVSKARARRTVRTIELTGLTSSGHDESDTALAREAAATAAETAAQEHAEPRKVAGA